MSLTAPYARPKLFLALWVVGMLGFVLITFCVLPELLPKRSFWASRSTGSG